MGALQRVPDNFPWLYLRPVDSFPCHDRTGIPRSRDFLVSCGKEQNPLKPLKAIQGWVANFFSCSGCRRHFMDMTTKTFPMEASNVKKPEDVVLYLWKAHNIVNKRLNGDEATEDPQFTKEQFPPTYLCPECQKSATGNGKDVELDPEKTLQFLLNYSTNIKARP
uniref:Sulfhydryl oxidase n=1 Tax=Globodera pallida TaxID=36090 RepID=A0A183C7Y4_GLOPA